MTEKRHWYQDWQNVALCVASIVLVGGCFIHDVFMRPFIYGPVMDVRVKPQIFTPAVLEVRFWHQYPGELKDGYVRITAYSPMLARTGETKTYAFASWLPNEEHAQSFEFPLTAFDKSTPVGFEVAMDSAMTGAYAEDWLWLNDQWKRRSDVNEASD